MTKDFWKFRAGQIVSQLGDIAAMSALSAYIVTTYHDVGVLGFMYGGIGGAMLVSNFFLGSLVDFVDKKHFLTKVDVLRGLIYFIVALGLFLHWGNVVFSVSLVALSATLAGVFQPASTAYVTELVPREEIGKALSQSQVLGGIGGILGGGLSFLLLKYASVEVCFFFNSASFLIAAYVTSKTENSTPRGDLVPRSLFRALVQVNPFKNYSIVGRIKSFRTLLFLMVSINFIMGVGAMCVSSLIVTRAMPIEIFGLNASSQMLGGLLGASVNMGMKRSELRKMKGAVSCLLVSFGLLLVPQLFCIQLYLFLMGFFGSIILLNAQSVQYKEVGVGMRGAASSLNSVATRLSYYASQSLFGFINQK